MNTKKYTKKYKNTKKSKKIINKKKTTKKLNRKFRKNKYKNFKGGMNAKEKKAIRDIIYELSDKFYDIENCIKMPDTKKEFIESIDEKFKSLQDKCRSCDKRINDILTNTSQLINDIKTNNFTNNYQTKYVEILNNLMALYDLFLIRDRDRRDSLINLQGRINPIAHLLHNSATPPPYNPATAPPLSPYVNVNSPLALSPPQITGSPLLPGPMTPPLNQPSSPSNSSDMTPLRNLGNLGRARRRSPRISPRNLPLARPIPNRPNRPIPNRPIPNRPVSNHLDIRYNEIFHKR